jgi:hypothetical protein
LETEASRSHQQRDPPLPALAGWLDNYAELVAAQIETRSSLGPNSVGAVEAAPRQVDRPFQGRSQGFGNLARLDLMTFHANGQPDPRPLDDRLRERLHPRGGVPSQQRPHDDPTKLGVSVLSPARCRFRVDAVARRRGWPLRPRTGTSGHAPGSVSHNPPPSGCRRR